jgi:hypothetical protein
MLADVFCAKDMTLTMSLNYAEINMSVNCLERVRDGQKTLESLNVLAVVSFAIESVGLDIWLAWSANATKEW